LEPAKTRFVIDFSLDALYKRTYDRIRARGDYLAAYNAALSLLWRRRRYPNLRVVVNVIDQDSLPAAELKAFQTFWRPLADDVVVRTYVDVKGSNQASKMRISANQRRWPCSLLWNRIAVSSFGRVRFCVDDWRERSAFDCFDLREQTIAEVWQSQQYQQLRAVHLKGQFGDIEICNICRDWFGLKWGHDYQTVIDRLYDPNGPTGRAGEVE
jgi:hypothetical protein